MSSNAITRRSKRCVCGNPRIEMSKGPWKRTVRRCATATEAAAALRASGHGMAAAKLDKCMSARTLRGTGRRPRICGCAACPWCANAVCGRWALGCAKWIGVEEAPSVTSVALLLSWRAGAMRIAVRRIRRALRDWRDRLSREDGRWSGVAVAGLVGADGILVLHIRHDALPADAVTSMIRRRWPAAYIARANVLSFDWTMADRLELAMARRGTEPIRVILAPQGWHSEFEPPSPDSCVIEPMPVSL
jgi:hypothetical protein